MSSIDKFFGRKYNPRSYNCAHFVVDVLRDQANIDIKKYWEVYLTGPSERTATHLSFDCFRRIHEPEDNAVVMMKSPGQAPHVGVFLRGRVLHIQPRGVEFQLLDVVTKFYSSHRFYRVEKDSLPH